MCKVNYALLSCLILSLLISPVSFSEDLKRPVDLKNVKLGYTKNQLLKAYPISTARTCRTDGNNDWVTYTFHKNDMITFYLVDDRVFDWKVNNREEIVKEYLSEFASGALLSAYPKIAQALHNALNKLPQDIFIKVTGRSHPIIFLDVMTTGIARFANSLEYTVRPADPPAFQNGFYIIKLGDELNEAKDVQAIEGIILHEIAHDVLEHLRRPTFSCEMERAANRLVKEWGYETEFKKASEEFGSKQKGDSSCQD